jgi:hypothetical protein
MPSAVDWYNYTSIVLQKGTRYAMLRYARVNRANISMSRGAAGSASAYFDLMELFFNDRYMQHVLCETETEILNIHSINLIGSPVQCRKD